MILSLGILLIQLAIAVEGPLTLNDFDRASVIQTDGLGPIFRSVLTEEVYRGLKHEDLREIRVFNAGEEIVPHSFELKTSDRRETQSRELLPFFPIQGEPGKESRGSAVEIIRQNGAERVEVRISGKGRAKSKGVVGYLADLQKHSGLLTHLMLEWNGRTSNSFLRIHLEGSDDLNQWSHVASGTVAKFGHGGQVLEQRSVDLPRFRHRYLKISWTGERDFQLMKLEGNFMSRERIDVQRNRTTLTPKSSEQGIYFYESPLLPVDRLRVELPVSNTVVRLSISSRSTPQSPWMERSSGIFFRVVIKGVEVQSDAVQLHQTQDRYWRVSVLGKDASVGGAGPVLHFDWTPHQLYFLARGTPPFRLAFGSTVAKVADFGFSSLPETLSAPDAISINASLGQATILEKAVKPIGTPAPVEPVRIVPWKKIALWMALGIALLLTSAMAWKLYSELDKKK